MDKKKRNNSDREQVTVYFDRALDRITKDWLANCRNKSYEIATIVVKYANGYLIEKSVADQEKKALLDRIEDYKNFISTILPNNTIAIETSPSSVGNSADITRQNTSIPNEDNNIKPKEFPGNNMQVSNEYRGNSPDDSKNDTMPQSSDSIQTTIGKYKGGRGYVRKGKGLADLQ